MIILTKKTLITLMSCTLLWTTVALSEKMKMEARIINNLDNKPYTVVVTTLTGKKISQSTFTKDTTGLVSKLYYDLDADADKVNLVKVYKGRFAWEKNLLYTETITNDEVNKGPYTYTPPTITIDASRGRYSKSYGKPGKIKQLAIHVQNVPDTIKTHTLVVTIFDSQNAQIDEQIVSLAPEKHTHKKIKVTRSPTEYIPIRIQVTRQNPKNNWDLFEAKFKEDEVQKATKLIINYRNKEFFSQRAIEEKPIYLE